MGNQASFCVTPGKRVRLSHIDPAYHGQHQSRQQALPEIERHVERMRKLQFLLYADHSRSLLVVLQALDAAGKDGTIRHLFSSLNPQGTRVQAFKQPSAAEAAHDFLWRAHQQVPARGEIVIFNRSHYEDVLVTRVHRLVKKRVWSRRYALINDFEQLLTLNGTRILKFFLHISAAEQLARFAQRLDDPARNWKISVSDYTEREFWPEYMQAYTDVLERTSTDYAPWYVIPADVKWFRDLAISQIVADTLEDMGLRVPPPQVDLAEIRRRYHAAQSAQNSRGRKRK